MNLPGRSSNAPFDQVAPVGAAAVRPEEGCGHDEGLLAALQQFEPDILLIVGWEVRLFRECARKLRGTCLRVVCMDNQWNRTPRQLLGIATRGFYLHPYFDAGFVAGHRQRVFMNLLGFEDSRIFDGFYSCDVNIFTPRWSIAGPEAIPRSFLFVGRLVDDKGIEELIAAYRLYRERVDHPWPVVVAGQGPLGAVLESEAGVHLRGFVQPDELPSTFAASSVLLVPSRYEPWGVVVHEAVTAGLGVIATTAVGSADLFLEPGVNGRVVPVGDVVALADAMQWAHELTDSERVTVVKSSRVLSTLRSPQSWVLAVDAMDDLRRSLTIGRDCSSSDEDT